VCMSRRKRITTKEASSLKEAEDRQPSSCLGLVCLMDHSGCLRKHLQGKHLDQPWALQHFSFQIATVRWELAACKTSPVSRIRSGRKLTHRRVALATLRAYQLSFPAPEPLRMLHKLHTSRRQHRTCPFPTGVLRTS
jgi:hypothetical protein